MPYVIDGNNLIGCSPDLSLDDGDAREKIVALVKKFQESRNAKVTIVFDGEPSGTLPRGALTSKFHVAFPRYGHTADDEIKKIISSYHQLSEVVLITSDRELKTFAKEKGARTKNSIEFYYELKKTYYLTGKKEEQLKRVNAKLSPLEVEQWLKIFKRD